MTNEDWIEIASMSNKHGYMSGIDRMSDRVKSTGEVFTPISLVIDILRKIPHEEFAPGKIFLDPACGDGQFLEPVKHIKMKLYNLTEEEALADIYGVDIMRDNVNLCKSRLGGGNIIMGDTLKPNVWIEGQTKQEHILMKEWFGSGANILEKSEL